jgi:hypothetical protein
MFAYRAAMPRAGAVVLSDLKTPVIWLVCDQCQRKGRYNVARLRAAHGDESLPTLRERIANCPKQKSFSAYDRCHARFVTSAIPAG